VPDHRQVFCECLVIGDFGQLIFLEVSMLVSVDGLQGKLDKGVRAEKRK
jgi:hypothetical protein